MNNTPRDPSIMLKILPTAVLCYAALLKNFTHYAEIMLNIYPSIPNKLALLWINSKYLKLTP